jgi:hypothetical protein
MTKLLRCTKCKRVKPNDGLKLCDHCRAVRRDQYYRLRKPKERARRLWMREMKASMSCMDCGASYPDKPARMHWDHRPGEDKIADVASLVSDAPMDALLAEIAKCDLVCNVCHAHRGHSRGQISPTVLRQLYPCEVCGTSVERVPSTLMGHVYCSKRCMGLGQRTGKALLPIHRWKPAPPPKPPKWWEHLET